MDEAREHADRNRTKDSISELTTSRLSLYLRCLNHLETVGVTTISSQDLADQFHLNSAQFRKDLACFGGFGIRGVGYDVDELRRRLIETLGLGRVRPIVIAGAGNLGMALAHARRFNTEGFEVVAMVDNDPKKIGTRSRNGIRVLPLNDLPTIVKDNAVDIGIIAVPVESTQEVYEAMVGAEIRAILNFAPIRIEKHDGVKVKDVDLRVNLETLSFHLRESEGR